MRKTRSRTESALGARPKWWHRCPLRMRTAPGAAPPMDTTASMAQRSRQQRLAVCRSSRRSPSKIMPRNSKSCLPST
eukprot:325086-Lingulodinium_polyedra.AAC.1